MLAGLLVLVAAVLFLGFWYVAVRALRRWTGLWRWLAMVPVVLVTGVAANIAIAPQGHTLWPFEVLRATLGAAVLLGVLAMLRTGLHARRHGGAS